MTVWMLLILYLIVLRVAVGLLAGDTGKKLFLTGAFVGIVVVMGLRYPAYPYPSTDLQSYYALYEECIHSSVLDVMTDSRIEGGYIRLNKAMAMVIPWPQFIFFAEAIMCVGAVMYFVYKNSDDVFLSIIYYVTLGQMIFHLTGFRQSIAMSVCLFAVEFAKGRRLFCFIATVLLAAVFHKTAVVFLPFYALSGHKLTARNLGLAVTCMALGVAYAAQLVAIANKMFGLEYAGEYVGNRFGGAVPILITIIALTLSAWSPNRKRDYACVSMTVIGLSIYVIRYVALPFERISFYFSAALIIVLANGITSVRDREASRLLYAGSVLCCIVLFLYRAAGSEWGPYRFFWQ